MQKKKQKKWFYKSSRYLRLTWVMDTKMLNELHETIVEPLIVYAGPIGLEATQEKWPIKLSTAQLVPQEQEPC